MTDNGWVKSHRAMLEHPLLRRADAMGVWCRLLLMAAHEPVRVFFRGRPVELARGQTAISVHAMADDLGLSHKRLRLILEKLSVAGSLKMDQAQGKAYSLVTICNYDTYQSPETCEGKANGKGRAKEGQTEQEPEESQEGFPSSLDSQANALPAPSEPTAKPSKDARSTLWDEVKETIRQDRSDADAGALVGRWIAAAGGGEEGEGRVFAGHFAAMRMKPAHYISFMSKKFLGKKGAGPPSGASLADEVARRLEENERLRNEQASEDFGSADAAPVRYEAAGQLH